MLATIQSKPFISLAAVQKHKTLNIQNYNFACVFVWVWNLASSI
jgi:hypothetical protein